VDQNLINALTAGFGAILGWTLKIVRDSIRVHSTSGWEATAYAGEVLDWQPNDPHEFVALESGSKLVNIVK